MPTWKCPSWKVVGRTDDSILPAQACVPSYVSVVASCSGHNTAPQTVGV